MASSSSNGRGLTRSPAVSPTIERIPVGRPRSARDLLSGGSRGEAAYYKGYLSSDAELAASSPAASEASREVTHGAEADDDRGIDTTCPEFHDHEEPESRGPSTVLSEISAADSDNHAVSIVSKRSMRLKKGSTSRRRGSWFGLYSNAESSDEEEPYMNMRSRTSLSRTSPRTAKARAAVRSKSATPAGGKTGAKQAQTKRAASTAQPNPVASVRPPSRMTPPLDAPGNPGMSQPRPASTSSNRRGSYFGLYHDPTKLTAEMQSLIQKFYGRPHVTAPPTRRLAYLNPDDEHLTAMDNNLEARRKAGMEMHQKLVEKTIERQRINEEWSAKREARRILRVKELARKEQELADARAAWEAEVRIRHEKKAQESMTALEMREMRRKERILLAQIKKLEHEREVETMRMEAEIEKRHRESREAEERAKVARQRAEEEANRRADKAYQHRIRMQERQVYEDATRWSEEEARAKLDAKRHMMMLLAAGAHMNPRSKSRGSRPMSRATSVKSMTAEDMNAMEETLGIEIGDIVRSRKTMEHGVVRYVGRVYFAAGVWLGVDMDSAVGKHDGALLGHRYFVCRPKHGIFVRPQAVDMIEKAVEANIEEPEAAAEEVKPASDGQEVTAGERSDSGPQAAVSPDRNPTELEEPTFFSSASNGPVEVPEVVEWDQSKADRSLRYQQAADALAPAEEFYRATGSADGSGEEDGESDREEQNPVAACDDEGKGKEASPLCAKSAPVDAVPGKSRVEQTLKSLPVEDEEVEGEAVVMA